MGAPTMRNVAKAARVSVATASRALHDAGTSVHPETRARVTAVAKEIGYRRLRGPQNRSQRGVVYVAEMVELQKRLAAAERQVVRLSQAVAQLLRERNGGQR